MHYRVQFFFSLSYIVGYIVVELALVSTNFVHVLLRHFDYYPFKLITVGNKADDNINYRPNIDITYAPRSTQTKRKHLTQLFLAKCDKYELLYKVTFRNFT